MTLNDRHAYVTRVLPDGRIVDVVPLTFGRARIIICQDERSLFVLDGY